MQEFFDGARPAPLALSSVADTPGVLCVPDEHDAADVGAWALSLATPKGDGCDWASEVGSEEAGQSDWQSDSSGCSGFSFTSSVLGSAHRSSSAKRSPLALDERDNLGAKRAKRSVKKKPRKLRTPPVRSEQAPLCLVDENSVLSPSMITSELLAPEGTPWSALKVALQQPFHPFQVAAHRKPDPASKDDNHAPRQDVGTLLVRKEIVEASTWLRASNGFERVQRFGHHFSAACLARLTSNVDSEQRSQATAASAITIGASSASSAPLSDANSCKNGAMQAIVAYLGAEVIAEPMGDPLPVCNSQTPSQAVGRIGAEPTQRQQRLQQPQQPTEEQQRQHRRVADALPIRKGEQTVNESKSLEQSVATLQKELATAQRSLREKYKVFKALSNPRPVESAEDKLVLVGYGSVGDSPPSALKVKEVLSHKQDLSPETKTLLRKAAIAEERLASVLSKTEKVSEIETPLAGAQYGAHTAHQLALAANPGLERLPHSPALASDSGRTRQLWSNADSEQADGEQRSQATTSGTTIGAASASSAPPSDAFVALSQGRSCSKRVELPGQKPLRCSWFRCFRRHRDSD